MRLRHGQISKSGHILHSASKREKSREKSASGHHAPYLVSISHPLTSTTNSSDTGRKTFQPSRIS